MKLKLLAGLALFACAVVSAANAPVTTALEGAIGRGAVQLVLTSSTGLVAGDQLYIDRELMTIYRISGNLVTVLRTKPVPHIAASVVTGGNSRFFTDQPRSGACEASDTYNVIQVDNGAVWSCAGVGSSWVSTGGGTLPAGWGATGTAMHKGPTGTRPTECDPANITAGLFCFWFDSVAKAIKTMNEDGTSLTLGAGGGAGVSVGAVGAGGASAPACGSTAFIYEGTDSGYTGVCDGASTYHWRSGNLKEVGLPTTTQTTGWLNQGTATFAAAGSTTVLTSDYTGSGGTANNMQGRYQTLPATPYTLAVCFVPLFPAFDGSYGSQSMGIFVGNGTNPASGNWETMFVLQGTSNSTGFRAFRSIAFSTAGGSISSFLVQNSSDTPYGQDPGRTQTCYGISDNGTTRKFGKSIDNVTWAILNSETHANYLVPTIGGFFVDGGNGGSPVAMQVLSYKVAGSALF